MAKTIDGRFDEKAVINGIKILVGKLAERRPAIDRAYERLEKAERNWEKISIPYYQMEEFLNSLKRKLSKYQKSKTK